MISCVIINFIKFLGYMIFFGKYPSMSCSCHKKRENVISTSRSIPIEIVNESKNGNIKKTPNDPTSNDNKFSINGVTGSSKPREVVKYNIP